MGRKPTVYFGKQRGEGEILAAKQQIGVSHQRQGQREIRFQLGGNDQGIWRAGSDGDR
jgi:hypothetical protein